MRLDVRPISSGKNSLTQLISEVNSEISLQRTVRTNGICAHKEILQIFERNRSFLRTRILSLGFPSYAVRRLATVEDVWGRRANTLQLLDLTFEPSFSLKKL